MESLEFSFKFPTKKYGLKLLQIQGFRYSMLRKSELFFLHYTLTIMYECTCSRFSKIDSLAAANLLRSNMVKSLPQLHYVSVAVYFTMLNSYKLQCIFFSLFSLIFISIVLIDRACEVFVLT